jgi:hypothetical protein
MIPLTRMKQREAQFFFGILDESRQLVVNNEDETYAFYLSAFLSAARAVTFALKFEDTANYKTWFPPWLESRNENERNLLNFMRDQRNYAQKRGSAEFTAADDPEDWEWIIPITEVRSSGHESRHAHGVYSFWAPWRQGAQVARRPYYFTHFSGDPNEVTSVCEKYLDILAQLVEDFVSWRQASTDGATVG